MIIGTQNVFVQNAVTSMHAFLINIKTVFPYYNKASLVITGYQV